MLSGKLCRLACAAAPFVLCSSLAGAETEHFEDQVHGHVFFSEYRDGTIPSIDYLVCNKTDASSDFFWTLASFGVNENELPAHHCLRRTDYFDLRAGNEATHESKAAEAFVLDKSAEVRTIYWCAFLGVDRCESTILGMGASWASTLREFAEEGSDEPQPIISLNATLEGGQYQIDIRRSDANGQLVVIAKTNQIEGVSMRPGEGVEAKPGFLGDFMPVRGEPLESGLSNDMSAMVVFSPSDGEGGVTLFVENLTEEPVQFAVVVLNQSGIALRVDIPALQASRF